MAAILGDLCDLTVPELYLNDPGNLNEPVNYIQCAEMGSACEKSDCNCRNTTFAMVDGSTMYFAVCVLLNDGASCVGKGTDSQFVDCSSSDTSSGSNLPGSVTTDSTSNSGSGHTSAASAAPATSAASTDGSTGTIDISKLTTTSEPSPISTPVLAGIIVACVVLVILVSCFVRRRCARKAAKNKMSSRQTALSPTHGPSESTPSFPAFCRNGRGTRSVNSRSGASRGKSPRGNNAGRGRRETSIPPGVNGVRGYEEYGEEASAVGYENMDIHQQDNAARAYAKRHQQGMQAAAWGAPYRSRPMMPLPPQRPPARQTYDVPISPGNTVYDDHITTENIMLLTQLAASEEKQRPQKGPMQVTGSIPKYPAAVTRQGSTSIPAFHIDVDPMPLRYSELSPRTTRSIAPSIASSATTVHAADHRRPIPNRQERRLESFSAPNRTGYREGNNRDESRSNSSFSSNALDTTWISTSRLVDSGGYPRSSVLTPMTEEIPESELGEVGDFSDWGASTQHTNDRYGSTGASSEYFFSSDSDSSEDDIYHNSDAHEL